MWASMVQPPTFRATVAFGRQLSASHRAGRCQPWANQRSRVGGSSSSSIRLAESCDPVVMTRSNVDPFCGHLWSRHIDGTICPPEPESDISQAARDLGGEPYEYHLSGPAELTEDDDPADDTTHVGISWPNNGRPVHPEAR